MIVEFINGGSHMLHGTQFNIAFILSATFVVAVLLSFGQIWSVFLIVAQLLMVYAGSEYLIRNLPNNIQQLQIANCRRADGSHSQHRNSVEKREHRNLRSNMRLLLFIGVAPLLLLLWHDAFKFDDLILMSAAWLIAAFFLIRNGYLYFLKQFVFHLKRRTQQYRLRDLDMIIREEEIVADRNRERHQLIEDGTAASAKPIILSPRPE